MTALKSPRDFADKLAKQWQRRELRVARWFAEAGAFPIELTIPAPNARRVEQLQDIKAHLAHWRQVTVGEVHWEDKNYRALAAPLVVPRRWQLQTMNDWLSACRDASVKREYQHYQQITQSVAEDFHRLLLEQKRWVVARDADAVIRACRLAEQLSPDIAGGAPLRALSFAGVDSKFFERHRQLITALLDQRFSGTASRMGLEDFLGAGKDEHWVTLADLDGGLLPFGQQKIRVSELQQRGLAPEIKLLVVENVQVTHLLPRLPKTLAILGTGLDLAWLSADWVARRDIVYWGDIDTWGLAMLARARHYQPTLRAVLMGVDCFDAHRDKAVAEPATADDYIRDIWNVLTPAEQSLYQQLKSREHGRLEQEFIPAERVAEALERAFQLTR